MNDTLLPFLQEFPASPRVADVQLQIRAMQTDIARLKAGDVKVSGVWYDKTSFAAEKYQIEAATMLDAMKRQLETDNYTSAMNSFDLLQRAYPNSTAYLDAIPIARNAVRQLLFLLDSDIADLPQTKARRQAAIDRTPIEQQQPVRQAIAAEDARVVATAALAQKNQQKFFTIFPFDEKGLKSMQTAATQIEAKIKVIDPKTLITNARLVRRAGSELDTHQLAGAQTSLAQLKLAWPAYEGLDRLQQRLEKALRTDKASAEALARRKAGAPQ